MKARKLVRVLLCVTGFLPAAASAAPGTKVLVMPFTVAAAAGSTGGAGASLWLGEAASILLTDRLEQLGTDVFTRDERVAAFERLQLPMSATLSRATMIRAAELVGATDIVIGEATVGGTLKVRARVIRLQEGRELPEVAYEAPLKDLFVIFERVAGQLAMPRAVAAPANPAGSQPATAYPALDAFENYVKGLIAATPAAQERFLETARKQAPRDPRVLLALWAVESELGAHEKALSMATAVAPDSPFSRKARFCSALSMLDLGRFDGALNVLSALDSERASPVIANAMGVVQLRRGGTTGTSAAYYFNRAVERDRSNADYLFNLGYAYALARDAQAALYWLREAVGHDTSSGDVHSVMAAVLTQAGRSVEAQREFELAKLLGGGSTGAATATPSDKVPPGLERLTTELDLASAPALTTTLATPAQREQQETASFHLEQGRKLFNELRDREAANELRRAIYLSPYESEPHVLLGRVLQRGGRLTDAIDEFKIAIWVKETADARVALAIALFENGDAAGARREAQRALALQPDFAAAKELLKRIGGL